MGCAGSKVQEPVRSREEKVVDKPKKAKRPNKNATSDNKRIPDVPEEVVPKPTYAVFQSSHDAKRLLETQCALRGATFVSTGNLVVADYHNNTIKLFDSNFKIISELEFSSAPWDVCQSWDDTNDVFVTVPFTKEVHKISTDINVFDKTAKLEFMEDFRTQGFCWGITSFDEGLAVSVKISSAEPNVPIFQVHLHDFDGTFKRAIVHDSSGSPYFVEPKYLSVTWDNLFLLVSDYKQNRVLCINNEDQLIYSYTGMKCPNGIAMDELKNLHITSFFGSQRVHKIGANGKYIDGLPLDEERPVFPHCICYRKKDRTIVLTTDNSVEVYKLC